MTKGVVLVINHLGMSRWAHIGAQRRGVVRDSFFGRKATGWVSPETGLGAMWEAGLKEQL